MGNQYYDDGNEERDAAEDRIRRIRSGGNAAPEAPSGAGSGYSDAQSDALLSAQSRARSARSALGLEDDAGPVSRTKSAPAAAGARGRQAFIVIGGVVAVGIVVVLIIILATTLSGNGLPRPGRATETLMPTETVMPTTTVEPSATPTRVAPSLNLPPLTCIFQSGPGCFDYCADPANQSECQAAYDFVEAQGADSALWISCIAPASGPNVGNPQDCLEQAWRSRNP